jgi:hypothetical protein
MPANKETLATDVEKAVSGKWSFAATAIADLRDKKQLSWKRVAEELGLGSPSSARRAYSELVRPHTESVIQGKGGRPAASGDGDNGWTPVDVTSCNTIAQVRDALAGHVVQVHAIRKSGHVRRLDAVKVANLDPKATQPTVDLVGADGKAHTVRLDKIAAVKPLA